MSKAYSNRAQTSSHSYRNGNNNSTTLNQGSSITIKSNMSGSNVPFLPQSPYHARAQTSHRIVDKSSIIYRDFLDGIKRRKRLISRLKEVAIDDSTSQGILKRMMLDIRQITLKVIEDALEIEYRSNFDGNKNKNNTSSLKNSTNSTMQLPPIASYRGMEDNEALYALTDMITDLDDLFVIPNMKVILPVEFPITRNPLLLGKTVDDLSNLVPPQPEAGNLEQELKVLELLRYKRAAKALLKAESQVMNKMPVSLQDIERIWYRMAEDENLDKIVRCVCTYLENNKPNAVGREPELHYLTGAIIHMEPHDFLMRMNAFRSDRTMRVDVHAAVRQTLKYCDFDHFTDAPSIFLVEWVNSALSNGNTYTMNGDMSTVGSFRSLPENNPQNYILPSGGGSIARGGFSYQDGHNSDLVSVLSGSAYHGGSINYTNETDLKPPIRKIQPVSRVVAGDYPKKEVPTDRWGNPLNDQSTWPSASNKKSLQDGLSVGPESVSTEQSSIPPLGGVQPAKGKTKAEKTKREKKRAEQIRVVRYELEKLLIEKGLLRPRDPDDENGVIESETISSMRYELSKLQKELLSRKVLDPRHYNASSLDKVTAERRGLTIPLDPMEAAQKKIKSQPKQIQVCEKAVNLRDGDGMLEVVLDVPSDTLVGRIHKLIPAPIVPNDDDDATVGEEVVAKPPIRETISYMRISKLSLNRITGLELDRCIDKPEREYRLKKLENIFTQLYQRARENPRPKGKLYPKLDRALYKNEIRGEGAVADMTITRNVECDGIHISILPMHSSEPLSLDVHDKELQVLLINQRSLFLLSQSKWECMAMVCQWLATRVKFRRVLLTGQRTNDEQINDLDDESVTSQLSTGTANFSVNSAGKNANFSKKNDNENAVVSVDPNSVDVPNDGQLHMIYEIDLNRKVDIPQDAYKQWRSRNIPGINGLQIKLKCSQELEMLRFDITVTIPHAQIFRSKLAKSEELVNFATTDDDDIEEIDESKLLPTKIHLNYLLTVSEIAIFGTADVMGERKIALSNKSGESHPAAFMWNVLARLNVTFKGSISDPYGKYGKADDSANWNIQYDRRLFRDVRTITGGVMVVTTSAIGEELLFEAEPTDGSIYSKVGSKLFEDSEITEMVYAEGWPLSLLAPAERAHLGYRILERLKVIHENDIHRLEALSYPETRILQVWQQGEKYKPDFLIGGVEINNHHTLTDLRTIIRFELEKDLVPKQYRFIYKGAPCAVRQEAFRKPWDCYPKIFIVPRQLQQKKDDALDPLAAAEEKKRNDALAAKAKRDKNKLEKGSRRVAQKLVPVPIFTLAQVQEGFNEVYLYHDSRDLLIPGDVIRIGDVRGRDYIISMRNMVDANTYPKTVVIEPVFDMMGETDFEMPICTNMPYDDAGRFRGRRLLKNPEEYGFKFDVPDFKAEEERLEKEKKEKEEAAKATGKKEPRIRSKTLERDEEEEKKLAAERLLPSGATAVVKKPDEETNPVWNEVWIWKCVPPDEDNRPKWRRLYDDGVIPYQYIYTDSVEYFKHFKVKVSYSYLEVLVSDVRCQDMTYYAQRVNEMSTLPLDYYTKLAFSNICDWFPQYSKGLESSKFIKLLRQIKIFPDITKASRIGQMDIIFQKEVKGENGIVEKYVNYTGFCRLLQEVALIRFPSVPGDNDLGSVTSFDMDDRSVGSIGSKESLGSLKKGKKGKPTKKLITKSSKKDTDSKSKGADSKSKASQSEVDEYNEQAAVDPEHAAFAYRKLVQEFILNVPEWSDYVWNEAKINAMRKEALRYCAATRIQAFTRSYLWTTKFKIASYGYLKLQAVIRKMIAKKRVWIIVKNLMEDWMFRVRYRAATKLVALARRFRTRCWFAKIQKKYKAQQVAIQKARRFRLKKLRKKAKAAIVYKETKRINGVITLLTVWRKDSRNYSRDYGIILHIYVPTTSTLYKFTVEEDMLRKFMCEELNVEAVNAGDLLDKRNLQKVVAARILIRKASRPNQPPQCKFSKQGLGQRGAKKVTTGMRIYSIQEMAAAATAGKKLGPKNGDWFVVSLFEAGEGVSVQCYHARTSKVFTCTISTNALVDWVNEEHYEKYKGDEYMLSQPPDILHKDKKYQLYKWALKGIIVDTKKNSFRVMFGCQLRKSRKLEMIKKIQSIWRKALVRPFIIKILDKIWLKVKVHASDPNNVYYLNLKTGESRWDKMPLLGPYDLIRQPHHIWVPFYYAHDGQSYEHYVNPYNGKYCHYTPDRATHIIQSLVRNHLVKLIMMPKDKFLRSANFSKNAKKDYDKNPKRLACCINLALVTHVVLGNEVEAKKLYVEALELSEANPLITRAFALFLIATCEAPILRVREKAEKWLQEAKRRDESNSKFDSALALYQFGLLRKPKDVRALTNLALVYILIYGNNVKGEKLLRRALSIAPFDERVIEIWKYLKDRFEERQLVYNPQARIDKVNTNKGGKKRTIHGRVATEDPSWAGWVYIDEDVHKVSKIIGPYWYNPVDGVETIDQPVFKQEWEKRKKRSVWKGEDKGLEFYYDPLTAEYFQWHELTDTYI